RCPPGGCDAIPARWRSAAGADAARGRRDLRAGEHHHRHSGEDPRLPAVSADLRVDRIRDQRLPAVAHRVDHERLRLGSHRRPLLVGRSRGDPHLTHQRRVRLHPPAAEEEAPLVVSAFPEVVLDIDEELTLAPFTVDDVPGLLEAVTDPHLRRWLPLPDPYTREVAETWCTSITPELRDSGRGLVLSVRRHGELAGCVDAKRVDWRAMT